MFTRGSKLFFGLGVSAYLAAVVYGVITNGLAAGGVLDQLSGAGAVNAVLGPLSFGYKGGVGDHVGYTMLMAFAATCVGLGIAAVAFRDGDPEALAELANSASIPPVSEPNDLSAWPVVAAFSAALMTVGLATGPALFVVGAGLLAVAAFEWTVKTWSEQATGDPEVNAVIRARFMHPVEVPVGALALIGILIFCASRIFLTVSKLGAVWAGIALLVLFFGGGVLLASVLGKFPERRRAIIAGTLAVGAVLMLGLGIASAINGERKIEPHETEHSGAQSSAPSNATGAYS